MRKKILLVIGAAILFAVGAFAGRMRSKAFTTIIYFTGIGVTTCTQVNCMEPVGACFNPMMPGSGGNQATINTCTNNGVYKLYATSKCKEKIALCDPL